MRIYWTEKGDHLRVRDVKGHKVMTIDVHDMEPWRVAHVLRQVAECVPSSNAQADAASEELTKALPGLRDVPTDPTERLRMMQETVHQIAASVLPSNARHTACCMGIYDPKRNSQESDG